MNPVLAGGLAVWGLVGFWVALALHRAGQDAATASLAVGCWPLFLHHLDRGSRTDSRVTRALERLDKAADEAGVALDLDPLRASLHATQARLDRIDALLAEDPAEPALLARRARASAVLEAALGDLTAIRLQVTLMSVDDPHPSPLHPGGGSNGPEHLRAAIADLRARLGAAAEVHR